MRIGGLLVLFIVGSLNAFAQKSKIEGKVTDSKTGSNLSGVSIAVDGAKAITSTNTDGYFQLNIDAGKKYTLRLTSVGFITKELADVEVKPNEVTHLDIILEASTKTETGVVIRSTTKKESVSALIAYQRNAPVVAQVISAEAIRRSPDKNTGEVLKRVPGTSVQEGKYLVVRGLADRYNQAMLNGILMSSTEPDRKTFSFDILPSSMIDNIIINKSFIPELPGEWAGGLIQVNTKDIPAKDFLSIQVGTGFNTQTIGKDFYTYKGSNTDFLGYDNGTRGLPAGFPLKGAFADLDNGAKTAYGKDFTNIWSTQKNSSNILPLLNESFLINGGFNKKLGGKNTLAAIMAVNYNRSNRAIDFENQVNLFQNNTASLNFDYFNNKYSTDILAGALANFTLQLGSNTKISLKNMLNVNTTDYTTLRTGKDFETNPATGDNIKAYELAFKANTFFNTQLTGDHNIKKYGAKLHWFGSFNILDQYIPDQRRVQYNQDDPTNPASPYSLLIGASKSSQKSGSRYYGFLNDYVYTAGGDMSKSFKGNGLTQTIKGGYFFQVKDRLFDARPFAIYLPSDNPGLRHLGLDQVFAQENFGTGFDNKFAFNELSGEGYRYIANSILNAGFLQFDNQITNKFRAVWGVRVENFDQVIGSMKKSDPRHVQSKVTDFLPGVNLTYKLTDKSNFRVSGSQTVIRPEFRELSTFQFYDFDLGATVAGNTALVRTKVTNFDLRYEMYPRAGELFTLGVFYKYFKNPIEAYFNVGSGGASTYNFINADEANSFGAEVEFRKKLDFNPSFKNFTVQGNVSYIYNRVTSQSTSLDRPMQGQSPYLLNAGLQYDIEKTGLTTTLLFNQIGRRIVFVGGSDQPPIWENPRAVMDFQVAKKIMKNKGELKLNVSDIFNQQAIYYNDLNDNKKYDKGIDAFAIKRKYGTNVSVSFGYNF
ncbi:outer membrane beta-barrel protein [Ferruginibacter paludis]|uniref:TonB-dependent receptor n=1 Tax=Ferruginibacter paludis TaxID=1310417 RepID=UPI0025B46F3F|nr:TonB-dependent receptor [Ferruginibacter paludis]MDN3658466.1 outer membrane beta-barrel protein [Ferruginibacter paludis]